MSRHRNDRRPRNTGLIEMLTEHIALLEALGHHVNLDFIGDSERPSLEVIPGLIWSQANNVTERLDVVDALAEQLPGKVRELALRRNGRHWQAVFRVNGVSSWSRYDRAQDATVPLTDDGDIRVLPASINCTTDDRGQSILPIDTPVNSVVLWRYVDGRKVSGKALPLDLDEAAENGWFQRFDDPVRQVTKVTLFPVLNRRQRGGREVVEGHAYHTSGKRMIAPYPLNWGNQGDVLLTERADHFVAVPLAKVKGVQAAIEAAAASVQVTAEEAWSVLAEFGATPDISYGELKKLQERVTKDKGPDAVGKRFASLLPEEVVEEMVANAQTEFAPIQAALERAFEIRGAEAEAVEYELGNLTLEEALAGAELKAFRARKDGEDLLTVAVATALGVPFDWDNGNHTGLRRKAITVLAKAAQITEPTGEDDAPPAPAAEPSAEEPPAP